MEQIGIIAGKGQFPLIIAKFAAAQGYHIYACGFVGHTDQDLSKHSVVFELLHLGQLNKLINFFKDNKVKKVCFAGAISKPKALNLRPDFRVAKLLFKLRSLGDDALLRALLSELESEGLEIVSAAHFAPKLCAPVGILSQRKPSPEEVQDIEYGLPIARNIGKMDIGQCIVVRRSMVMAIECLEGTDATLKRGAELGGKGCLAIKIVKPNQDLRIDLPSIGLETINTLIENNYSCLAFDANNTLFFDQEEAILKANQHKLCLVGIKPEQELCFNNEV